MSLFLRAFRQLETGFGEIRWLLLSPESFINHDLASTSLAVYHDPVLLWR
ncbi:hypothetical protein [Psychrobacter pygoscelis]|nr:hypothetical protein [Psychrobacter pygoscelis]